MTKLLALPANRRLKWLFAAAWLILMLGSGAANLPGKFADAEKNE